MINAITRYIDPKDILDRLQEGKVLRVIVWGPRREYIQVAVASREEMAKAKAVKMEQTDEPEVQGRKEIGND